MEIAKKYQETCSVEYVEGQLEDIVKVNTIIPEFDNRIDRSVLEQRLAGKCFKVIIAKTESGLAGYCLAYELSINTTYIWLGGVIPQCRRLGAMSGMFELTECWAKHNGQNQVVIKSMNKFPAMLHL